MSGTVEAEWVDQPPFNPEIYAERAGLFVGRNPGERVDLVGSYTVSAYDGAVRADRGKPSVDYETKAFPAGPDAAADAKAWVEEYLTR